MNAAHGVVGLGPGRFICGGGDHDVSIGDELAAGAAWMDCGGGAASAAAHAALVSTACPVLVPISVVEVVAAEVE